DPSAANGVAEDHAPPRSDETHRLHGIFVPLGIRSRRHFDVEVPERHVVARPLRSVHVQIIRLTDDGRAPAYLLVPAHRAGESNREPFQRRTSAMDLHSGRPGSVVGNLTEAQHRAALANEGDGLIQDEWLVERIRALREPNGPEPVHEVMQVVAWLRL